MKMPRLSMPATASPRPDELVRPSVLPPATPTAGYLEASQELIKRTDAYTYFTKASGQTELLYSSEKWVTVTLNLETAGPVGVSTRADIAPVLSGKSILLTTGEDRKIVLPKGNRLYIISESINRVKFIVEPYAWDEEIYNLMKVLVAQGVAATAAHAVSAPTAPAPTATRTTVPMKAPAQGLRFRMPTRPVGPGGNR